MPAGTQDGINQLQGIVTNLSQLAQVFQTGFPRIFGTFTLAAQTTTVVAQPAVAANSYIPPPTPTNAAAALTQRTSGIYISAINPGVSFSVSTESGAASGTETFQYAITNPG